MPEHTWMQIGTLDNEGMRTHSIPGDVCVECSDAKVGRWVPVSQCVSALKAWEEYNEAILEIEGRALELWEDEGGLPR